MKQQRTVMANSAQLSKNNKNAQIWTNWGVNTERNFKTCIKEVVATLETLYPNYTFEHQGSLSNQTVIESYIKYNPGHMAKLNGSNGGSANPDGGIIYVTCNDSTKMPVFIGENKHQEDNPGNAIERSLKNITMFKGMLINEDYFPYLINVNGPIVNERKGSLFDRITQDGGFMPANVVHVKSNPNTPRLRPFTISLDKEFEYDKIKQMSLDIIAESISYLISKQKL